MRKTNVSRDLIPYVSHLLTKDHVKHTTESDGILSNLSGSKMHRYIIKGMCDLFYEKYELDGTYVMHPELFLTRKGLRDLSDAGYPFTIPEGCEDKVTGFPVDLTIFDQRSIDRLIRLWMVSNKDLLCQWKESKAPCLAFFVHTTVHKDWKDWMQSFCVFIRKEEKGDGFHVMKILPVC